MRSSPLALLALMGAGPALSQQTPAPPCASSEYRQMDFWVGTWDVEFDNPNGTVGTGTNVIARDGFGPCAITERFSIPGWLEGGSYSIFDRQAGRWRQMWVDNQGGTFTLVGGPVEGQGHRFELRTVEPGQDQAFRRMIWEDVTSSSMVWRWQKQEEAGTWSDLWVLRYRRREGS